MLDLTSVVIEQAAMMGQSIDFEWLKRVEGRFRYVRQRPSLEMATSERLFWRLGAKCENSRPTLKFRVSPFTN